MMNIFIVFLISVSFFQFFYILNIVICLLSKKDSEIIVGGIDRKISIIIPLFNSEKTIGICLDSILKNDLFLIEKIVIVLDHCNDTSSNIVSLYTKKFEKAGICFLIVNLNAKKAGKVDAIKYGIKFIKTENVLLLDADIILRGDSIKKLLNFHIQNSSLYSSCFVYPFQQKTKNNFITQIIYQDHLYRQNILKFIRNKYNVANFPGSIGIVNIKNYSKFLNTGFLEDLAASFHIINERDKVSILPEVLAYEVERQSLKGLLFQRVRWTVGNIENFLLLLKTMFLEKNFLKKVLIISYPIMWYIQHYVIFMGIITILFYGFKFVFLIPFLLYFLQILLSVWLGKKYYNSTILGVVGHCIIFPLIIFSALFGAIVMILLNKKFYFKKSFLFDRI